MTDELRNNIEATARQWDKVALTHGVAAQQALDLDDFSEAATACHRAYQATLRAAALRSVLDQ